MNPCEKCPYEWHDIKSKCSCKDECREYKIYIEGTLQYRKGVCRVKYALDLIVPGALLIGLGLGLLIPLFTNGLAILSPGLELMIVCAGGVWLATGLKMAKKIEKATKEQEHG